MIDFKFHFSTLIVKSVKEYNCFRSFILFLIVARYRLNNAIIIYYKIIQSRLVIGVYGFDYFTAFDIIISQSLFLTCYNTIVINFLIIHSYRNFAVRRNTHTSCLVSGFRRKFHKFVSFCIIKNRKAVRGARTEAWFYVHNKIHEVEHENVGVEGAHKSELVAEAGARKLTWYAKRRWQEHPARKVAKWERKEVKARANVEFQKMASEHPELASNPLSRVQQKWKLKRRYSKEAKAAAKQGAKTAKKTVAASGTATRWAAQFVTRHPVTVLVLLLLFLLCFLVSAVSSIFPTLGSGLANALSGTSYASEDTNLLGVDEDYTALENELAQTVANIESTHPGYDEYRYSVDEIGHNPYELASYLSAKYHVYFREQVQDELREIFEAQYELTLTEEVEIRYRTETSTDPETGETTTEEVPYEYYILNVTLTNKTLPAVILPRLDEQQRQIYTVMQQLKGNKPYLWEGIYNGGEDTGPSYEIPGEALDDPAFAALMEEATKYIGWPYVWGGSSPSTSFDCSGFVCWVYTASGVHNLPRTTAQGIYNQCAIISPSEAKPGDIIFFTGTYDSPGPVSHVGIYVGDGMMLHCGSPIQYANINSSYWQTHFYAFGRL